MATTCEEVFSLLQSLADEKLQTIASVADDEKQAPHALLRSSNSFPLCLPRCACRASSSFPLGLTRGFVSLVDVFLSSQGLAGEALERIRRLASG